MNRSRIRPFAKGTSFLVSYAYNNEKRQEWFDDIAQYRIFTTGQGWEWRPAHRCRSDEGRSGDNPAGADDSSVVTILSPDLGKDIDQSTH